MKDREITDRPWVVLVDDEPAILAALRRLLRNEPYHLLATDDPLEALQALGEKDVRVLVTDQRMPRMTGTELTAWVKARFPDLPLVVLTGYAETALIVEREHLRIQRLLTKPWNDVDLRNLIRELGGFSGKRDKEPALLRVDCTGRSEIEVLGEILPELELAREGEREVAVVIDRFERLEGSLARFLFSLLRLSIDREVKVTLLDGSGLVQTALDALGGTIVSDGPQEKAGLRSSG
jgi:CheY-like chemotaxis protein